MRFLFQGPDGARGLPGSPGSPGVKVGFLIAFFKALKQCKTDSLDP